MASPKLLPQQTVEMAGEIKKVMAESRMVVVARCMAKRMVGCSLINVSRLKSMG